MENIIILIILSLVSVIFLIRIHKNGNKLESLSFLSTMIATLFGVLLAITLSNIEDEKKEINNTIKLLNSGLKVLQVTYACTNAFGNIDIETEQDSSEEEDSQERNRQLNPLPDLVQLETIIASETVSKNLSEVALLQIYAELINARNIGNYDTINRYKEILKRLFFWIKVEIAYLKGNITLEEIQSQDQLKTQDQLKIDLGEIGIGVDVKRE